MAKVKVRREGNLLWEDKCQPLTTEQMNDIKSQFHPSNTANVNIVPYEIYDEDGVEQVVGEVRKTIDGVKKRKPLYRITAVGKSPSTAGSESPIITYLSSNVVENITRQDVILLSNTEYILAGWQYGSSAYAVTNVYARINGNQVLMSVGVSAYCNCDVFATIEFTKTTDEWQPV